MRKYIHTLFIGIFFTSSFTYSQEKNYRTSTLEKNSNYYEIVKEQKEKLAPLKKNTDRKSKKEIKQFKRWAAFWKDRINEDGSFVSATHTYNELKKELEKINQRRQESSKNLAGWSLIGPTTPPVSDISFYPGMGRINTIAFNGADTNTMYIGSPGGGVWKTTDGGNTWSPKGDTNVNLGVSHIVIDPATPSTLYLATGDWDGVHNRSLGVLKSTDSGDTWVTTGLMFSLNENNLISKLLIDPNNVNTVFATTKNSIKRTTNGGNTWADVHIENNSFFNDIQYKTGSNSIIYATTKNGEFYRSTNNGDTWSLVSSPANNRLDIAQTANDVNLLLSLDENGVIKKSTNQGSTWSTVSTISEYSSQGGYDMTITISPIDKDLVLVGGIHGWRSNDGGSTWEKYLDGYWQAGDPYFYVHSDHHDMLFVPGTNVAFSLNDGGVFKGDASLDAAWTDLSSGLAITQYYNVSGTPQDAGKLILGAQDNDIAIYDNNGFKGENPGSDGVEGLWDYSNSNFAWACSQEGGLTRTTDGFATDAVQLTTPSGAPFIWELEIHPTTPTTIFGGFADIYKSTNRGDTWTNLNSGVGTVEFISVAPSNANIIYVSGENGDVKKTSNGGTAWQTVNLPQSGTVKSIEINPVTPTEIYIAYSGYLAGKVYKSTNSGSTWTNITGSLPNIPTHQIRYKTGTADGELFLATDLGVYYRTDTADDWVKLGTGLPNVIVHDIEIHYGTEKIRAATYGRGVWETSISATDLGVDEDLLAENAVIVYPNPTRNKNFSIKLNNLSGESSIVIYNIIGSVVKNFNTFKIEERIDLTSFSQGMYFVKVSNNGKTIVKKVIVE